MLREGSFSARCIIVRLMRKLGLSGTHRVKRNRTPIPDPQAARTTGLVKRHFDSLKPNRL